MEFTKTVKIACDAVAAAKLGLPVYTLVEVSLTQTVMATLTEPQCDALARFLAQESVHVDWSLSEWQWEGARWRDPLPAVVVQPLPETGSRDTQLAGALGRSLDIRVGQMERALAHNRARLAKTRAEIDAMLHAVVPTEVRYLELQADGTVARYQSDAAGRVRVELYQVYVLDKLDAQQAWFTDEQRALQDKRRTELEAENRGRVESMLPALKQAALERARELAAEQAVYDALYAQLPAVFRERAQDGFATEREVHAALRTLSRQERGYAGDDYAPPSRYWDEVEHLTDVQYARVKQLRARLRDDESFSVRLGYSYRPATEADEPEAVDNDDEVRVEHGVRAHIAWEVPQLGTVAVEVPL